ncbi:polysaccharide biosynthesis/export family protein [Burkholderia multivorans]|uniref:polysaccharide biosynthesis/export family protein n=1 Tax=Burkholderia multivorans TaxID=87883 RepID=UPI00018E5150|nr:polysaccharide biosynthesis/export family protein [Burkholderia multivorans]EEE14522.1 exopolysaccharide export protein [Burkholderia multivorans CGD2M]
MQSFVLARPRGRFVLCLLSLAFLLAGCSVLAPGMSFVGRAPLAAADVPVIELDSRQIDALNDARKHRADGAIADTAALARAGAGARDAYRIGPADVLSIIVWDHPELVMPNLTYDVGSTAGAQPPSAGMAGQSVPGYLVSADGCIQFPYVKRLAVAGLSEADAQQRLARALQPYVRDAQVSLRVVGFRSKKVYVNGEVRSPGVKPITDVPMTLANALNEASGVLDSGDASHIALTRGGRRYRIDLPRLAESGLDAARIVLQDGDELRVPPARDYSVFVMGEVLKPGPLPLRSDGRLTLSQALGAAQINQVTSDPSRIYLVRPARAAAAARAGTDAARGNAGVGQPGAQAQVFHFDARSPQAMALAQRVELEPDDVVFVDAAGVVRWNRVISQLVGGTAAAYNIQRASGG